jgi:hypothetical protein
MNIEVWCEELSECYCLENIGKDGKTTFKAKRKEVDGDVNWLSGYPMPGFGWC